MSWLRLAACAIVFTAAAARGQTVTLLHEYDLSRSLADNLGGPALVAQGGSITASGYLFGLNQGLQLTSPALSAGTYSIELSFSFDTVGGYRKILDFQGLTPDSGFYVLNGQLNFYPIITASVADFSAGKTTHVVLTRNDATGNVVGYVDGVQRFTFADTGSLALFSAPGKAMNFFIDDFATGQGEASAGLARYLRIYNGDLSPSAVLAAFQAGAPLSVPEPSALALLALGLGLLLVCRRRRA